MYSIGVKNVLRVGGPLCSQNIKKIVRHATTDRCECTLGTHKVYSFNFFVLILQFVLGRSDNQPQFIAEGTLRPTVGFTDELHRPPSERTVGAKYAKNRYAVHENRTYWFLTKVLPTYVYVYRWQGWI